jgi:hypothetical protein
MQLINKIPFSMLLVLGIVGVLLLIGFSLYRKLILPRILLKENGQAHHEGLIRLEIILWAIFILSVIYYGLVTSLPVTLILLGLVLFAFFDFWRNYFTGISLKFGHKLQIGDSISVNSHSGKIVAFGNRALKMINEEGEEMLIPYTLINKEVKIGQKSTPKILYKPLVLENMATKKKDLRQTIERAIYANPWILISNPVNIAIEKDQVMLNFYVLNNDFFEKARRQLVKDLGIKD